MGFIIVLFFSLFLVTNWPPKRGARISVPVQRYMHTRIILKRMKSSLERMRVRESVTVVRLRRIQARKGQEQSQKPKKRVWKPQYSPIVSCVVFDGPAMILFSSLLWVKNIEYLPRQGALYHARRLYKRRISNTEIQGWGVGETATVLPSLEVC